MTGVIRAKIETKLLAETGLLADRWVYGWTEQISDIETALDKDGLSPRFGTVTDDDTYSSPALEVNDAEVAVDTIVWLRPRGYLNNQIIYEFLAPVAEGDIPSDHVTNTTFLDLTTDSWTDVPGVSIDIPDAGIYLLGWSSYASMHLDANTFGTIASISFRLWDDTNSAVVQDSIMAAVATDQVGVQIGGCAAKSLQATTAGPVTLKLQACRNHPTQAGMTWVFAFVPDNSVYATVVTYVKLDRAPGGSGPAGPAGATGATGATGAAGADGDTIPDAENSLIGIQIFGR